ncbi:alginate export family protein [Thalassotalea maritima]|uniref:alginate export family protein n=1 Tax=Thalassotalea maritima TaxID=3242416 RepID=UPI003527D253
MNIHRKPLRLSNIMLATLGLVLSGTVWSTYAEQKNGQELSYTPHVQLGINAVREEDLFWDLAGSFARSANYDPNKDWLELYVKPGIRFGQQFTDYHMYGNVSVVASATAGTDAYETGDTGRLTLEEAYVGFKTADDTGLAWDISAGARELKLGSGMLIANGATSGFERGALKLGPRKAWERAVIIKGTVDTVSTTVFYLDPNELDSNNTDTQLAGLDIRMPFASEGSMFGFTYGHVLQSGSPYPKAAPAGIGPPSIIENGRDNLSFINHYGLTDVYTDKQYKVFSQWDVAYQWNSDIDLDAWGGRIKLGTTLLEQPWQPTLVYSYQTFSGDDPNTDDLERFDPLYYEGSPSSWSTGSKSSMVFINSNVQSHQLTLTLKPSEKHIINLRAAHIRVNELKSPVQFGQASRLDFADGLSTVVTGVADEHLADDYFIEYTYVMSPTTFITMGLSLSEPGDGITKAVGLEGPSWSGGFVNLVMFLQ